MCKMITLQASNKDIQKIIEEAAKKSQGVAELTNPFLMKEFSDAIFTVTSKAFIKALNIEARSNPKAYHHIYEWGKVGNNASRLVVIEKVLSSSKRVVLKANFLDSKTAVPIPAIMQEPGTSGRSVTKKNIFAKKAIIMESGRAIIYRTKKNTPMNIGGELKFIAAGTLIRNFNPGGVAVRGAFGKFFELWFNTKAESVINSSGMMKAVQEETAKILSEPGAGSDKVRSGITQVYKQYSKGEVTA